MSEQYDRITLVPLGLQAYDPHRLEVRVGGDRVSGHPPKQKVSLRRGLNGVASADVFVHGLSHWVPKLRQSLGFSCSFEVEYKDETFKDHFGFAADMILLGYDVDYTGEVPVFVFHFENDDRLLSRARSR